jgi:hypothetical protein
VVRPAAATLVVVARVAVALVVRPVRLRLVRVARRVLDARPGTRATRLPGDRRPLTIRLAPPDTHLAMVMSARSDPRVDPARSSGRAPGRRDQLGHVPSAEGPVVAPVRHGRWAVQMVVLAMVVLALIVVPHGGVTTSGRNARRAPSTQLVLMADPHVQTVHTTAPVARGPPLLTDHAPVARIPIVQARDSPGPIVAPTGAAPVRSGRLARRTPDNAIALTGPASAPAPEPGSVAAAEPADPGERSTRTPIAHPTAALPTLVRTLALRPTALRPTGHREIPAAPPGMAPHGMAGRHVRNVMAPRHGTPGADHGPVTTRVLAPVPGKRATTVSVATAPAVAGLPAMARAAVHQGAAHRGAAHQGAAHQGAAHQGAAGPGPVLLGPAGRELTRPAVAARAPAARVSPTVGTLRAPAVRALAVSGERRVSEARGRRGTQTPGAIRTGVIPRGGSPAIALRG